MQNNDRKPEIRFSGFEAGWKKKRFGDEFDILSNNTLSRDFLNYDQGIGKNVHYGDVLVKFNEYLNASKEILPFIEDREVIDKFQNSFLKDGDIVIADTAEDETVGKCIEIGQIGDLPIIAGLHTMPCRPKAKYAPMYLGYYLNANAYHRELLPLMQGVKVTSISRSGVKDTDIIVSEEYDEQKKIGQFLFTLDEKIKFEEDKLDRLIILKKSMLEKMFPQGNSKVPEIRFGKYTGEWELRKLGEVINFIVDNRGKNPEYYCTDGIPVIDNYMIKNTLYPNLSNATRYIDDDLYNNFIRKYNEIDDVLITLVGNGIGNITLFPAEKAVIIQNTLGLRAVQDKRFLFFQLMAKNKDIVALDRGMAQPSIRQDEVLDIDILIPSNEEQKKIGKYFSSLDNLITLHQRKVDKLKNIKSSCMDKMFV